jgi:hypothetical protein
MNVTVQAEEYCTARPLDKFAKSFLTFLDDWFYVQDGIQLEIDKYLKTVKVFECTDRFWNRFLDLRETKMWTGDTGEYDNAPPRENIDGVSIPPVAVDRNTRQLYLIPREIRVDWHSNTFPMHFARRFAEYDGLIFLYHPERWDQNLTPAMLPQATRAQFDEFKAYRITHAKHRTVAHECLHLCQRIWGGKMPRWNPATDLDPVERLFDEYLGQLTLAVFDQLYLPNNGEAAADQIDL